MIIKKLFQIKESFQIAKSFLSTKNSSKDISYLFENNDSIFHAKSNSGSLAIVSLSNDIYANLALENYIAEAINLKNQNVMLLWISEPCIVFGRHQNPWLECNTKQSQTDSVKLARRYSGGGCVYHDYGNLNISFICDRFKYDRKFNLNLIKQTIEENFKLNENILKLEVSPRHDIFANVKAENFSYKVSGSASRLAKNFSYHHCTLLFDANMTNMKLLKSNLNDKIETKATPSVRSKVVNLKQFFLANMNDIIEAMCKQYWKNNSNNWLIDHLFAYVNPEASNLVNLFEKDLKELKSWDYIYGQTPKFRLNIKLIDHDLVLIVENGLIKNYELKSITNQVDHKLKNTLDLFLNFRLVQSDLLDLKSQIDDPDVNLNEFFNFIQNNLA